MQRLSSESVRCLQSILPGLKLGGRQSTTLPWYLMAVRDPGLSLENSPRTATRAESRSFYKDGAIHVIITDYEEDTSHYFC